MRLTFWLAAAAIAYVYAGYPLLLAMLSRRRLMPRTDETLLPTVSLVIAAHNEEKVIREKLENSLALDYPPDRLEVVVASDGSDDATNRIVTAFASRGVKLVDIRPRGGKTRALNAVVPTVRGEIVVLSDANTMYRPDSIRKLVRHFADPQVGAVTGDVKLVDSADDYAQSEGLYYKYERWIQKLESRCGSVVGADGAMYALRQPLFRPVDPRVVVDDFVISMNVAAGGHRLIYDEEAIAIEQGTLSSAEEYRRKVRIVAGGFQALFTGQGVPSLREPQLLCSYISHKLLRWLLPVFLLATAASSLALAPRSSFFALAVGVQAVFYVAALFHAADVRGFRRLRAGIVPYYFCLVNGAALQGLCRAVARSQPATWSRTNR
jgi:cellulose synthase/poly-beta-1,6-N-acetylglucosamine synthase-like glycosyltransferase